MHVFDEYVNGCLNVFVCFPDTSSSYRGFEGCITHMQIDSFYPLQKAFQIPTPSYVHMFPSKYIFNFNCTVIYKDVTSGQKVLHYKTQTKHKQELRKIRPFAKTVGHHIHI